MRYRTHLSRLMGVVLAMGLLWSLACGSSEEAAPAEKPAATPTKAAAPAAASTPTPKPKDTSKDPVYGGTVRITDTVRSMDIGTVAGNPGEYNQMEQYMSQLIRVSLVDRVTIEGDLAESWTLEEGGTAYKFKLRDNLIDHSGRQWTADDVAYSVWKIMARPLKDPLRRIMCWSQGAADTDPNGPAAGTAVEVTGPLEFVVRTKSPVSWYPACMAQHFSLIGNADVMKKIVAEGKFREASPEDGETIGTGPFYVKEYIRGNRVTFEKFDQFFREGLPYIDRVEITHVTELASKVAAVAAGRSEGWIYGPCCEPNLSDIAPLKKQYKEEFVVPQSFAFGTASFIVNMQRAPFGPQDDPTARKIRKAVQLFIDRTLENDLIYEGLGFQIYFYYCGFDWILTCDEWMAKPGHAEDPAKKDAERAEAKAIMEGLGYSASNMLSLELLSGETGSGRRTSELLAEDLKAMHIAAKLRIPPGGESVYDDQFAGRFDLVYDVSGYGLFDPVIFDQNKYMPLESGSENYGRWENAEWMKLYEQQLAISDQKERGAVYKKMVDILFEDLPIFPMNRMRPPHPYMAYVRGWYPKKLHASTASLEAVWLTPNDRKPWPVQAKTDIYDTGLFQLK